VKAVLAGITAIADHPDEITNRFNIIRILEDIAFQSNLLALNVGLMVSRAQPEHAVLQKPLCNKFYHLAQLAAIKTSKIVEFFAELTALIFADIQKNLRDKVQKLIEKAHEAVEEIIGYSYIKDEVEIIAKELSSTPMDKITISGLESLLFRVNILSFAAKTDIFRIPQDKIQFEKLIIFRDTLLETIEFYNSINFSVTSMFSENQADSSTDRSLSGFRSAAFQMNILLFYTRGEVSQEKLGKITNVAQKAELDKICQTMNRLIHSAHNAADGADGARCEAFAQDLEDLASQMAGAADNLEKHGQPIRFLGEQVAALAERVKEDVGQR
jgi:methyl-accepting chemotaxis protein